MFSVVVTTLQVSHPSYLPSLLQDWTFLPLWLHSLEPWDKAIMAAVGCCCRKKGWDDGLKEVIITNTPKDSSEKLDNFDSVNYNTLPIAKLVTRQRSSNSFSLLSLGVLFRITSFKSSSAQPFLRQQQPTAAMMASSQGSKEWSQSGRKFQF